MSDLALWQTPLVSTVWEMAVANWGSTYSVVASHVWNADVIGRICVESSLHILIQTCEYHVAIKFVTLIVLHV